MFISSRGSCDVVECIIIDAAVITAVMISLSYIYVLWELKIHGDQYRRGSLLLMIP